MKSDEILPADLSDLLDAQRALIFSTFNCIQIGKIEKVTPGEQTVEVTLQIKRPATDGTSSAIPLLVDVPYFVLQGGGAYIDMPITPGDYCIVLFNDRDIDTWWSTANMADPATSRKHDLSDGIAIVGINPKTDVLEMAGTSIGLIAADKKVRIKNDIETLFTLMGDLIDAVSGLTTYGSPASHSVTAASKAALATIKTRFQSLLEE